MKAKPVTLKLVPQPGVIVGTKEVVATLKHPDGRILDVRSVKEFMGAAPTGFPCGYMTQAESQRVAV